MKIQKAWAQGLYRVPLWLHKFMIDGNECVRKTEFTLWNRKPKGPASGLQSDALSEVLTWEKQNSLLRAVPPETWGPPAGPYLLRFPTAAALPHWGQTSQHRNFWRINDIQIRANVLKVLVLAQPAVTKYHRDRFTSRSSRWKSEIRHQHEGHCSGCRLSSFQNNLPLVYEDWPQGTGRLKKEIVHSVIYWGPEGQPDQLDPCYLGQKERHIYWPR